MPTEQSYRLMISGMHCASCANKIEQSLSKLPGVIQVQVNFAERTAHIKADTMVSSPQLIAALRKLGYDASVVENRKQEEILRDAIEKRNDRALLHKTIFAFLIGVPVFILTMAHLMPSLSTQTGQLLNGLLALLTLSVLIYSGADFFVGAWQSCKNLSANMNTLIALGTGTAWLYSLIALLLPHALPEIARHVYFESAVIIIALVNLGALLEARARRHTSDAIQRLIKLQPSTACVIEEQNEIDVPIEVIQVGALIRVRPGEQIPVDGIIIEGSAYLDEAMLTGEMRLKQKNRGDHVVAGTINKTGSFIFQATHVGQETVLAQIIQMVQQAQNSKPKLARLADQISAVFVPVVMLIALVTAIIWLNTSLVDKIGYSVVTVLSVLMIACPCALGLAVPMSVMIGIGKAAEYGILIRQADSLQQAKTLKIIVLDKTGTITEGKPSVTGIYPVVGWHAEQLLTYGASVEIGSEHAVAEAILRAADEQNIVYDTASDFQAISGLGVSAVLNKQRVTLGNKQLMAQRKIDIHSLVDEANRCATLGQTPVYLALNDEVIGFFAVSDAIKADAKEAIQRLQQMGLQVVMLTGDHVQTAQTIAKQVGIKLVYADVLPQDKANIIKQLQHTGKKVAMVGDGINDTPALAQADVGFAIGSATDIAIESADITLMGSSLFAVIHAMMLSKQIMRNMQQNLWGALIYNVLSIPIAAGILFPFTGMLLNPMLAGLAMALSSFTVVSNANRLRFKKL